MKPTWEISHRADSEVVPLADRHYNRQKIGSPQFVPPGRCVVLKLREEGEIRAFWITSWPFGQYVKHAWPGAWVCSAFRNESSRLSSELIREAIQFTLSIWPEPPETGCVTFISTTKVRKKRDFGRCFRKAGFKPANPKTTKGGLIALQLVPSDFP